MAGELLLQFEAAAAGLGQLLPLDGLGLCLKEMRAQLLLPYTEHDTAGGAVGLSALGGTLGGLGLGGLGPIRADSCGGADDHNPQGRLGDFVRMCEAAPAPHRSAPRVDDDDADADDDDDDDDDD
eukprot:3264741-Prymnesium_polylepis.1